VTVHVLLVRHARSTANAQGVLAGRMPDVHLDGEGIAQSDRLAERLAAVPVTRVIGSPMERCRETAEPICIAHRLRYEVDERLIECDYGTWSGRPLSECAQEPLWPAIQSAPSTVTFPEGESMASMSARGVAAVLDAVSAASDGDVLVVVSHGDVIKAIVAHVMGLDLDRFQAIVVDPASVTLLRFAEERAFLVRHNDSHATLETMFAASADAALGGGSGSGGAMRPEQS
jgi:probable phosphomutase (TIGR03848 family)